VLPRKYVLRLSSVQQPLCRHPQAGHLLLGKQCLTTVHSASENGVLLTSTALKIFVLRIKISHPFASKKSIGKSSVRKGLKKLE